MSTCSELPTLVPRLSTPARADPLIYSCAVFLPRVRVEIMGSQKCGIVGKSQPVRIVTNPMISPRFAGAKTSGRT
jgi:hypothetical protein